MIGAAFMYPATARALLAESRRRTAKARNERHLRAALRDLGEVMAASRMRQINQLRLVALKADERRFTGQAITGFGGL